MVYGGLLLKVCEDGWLIHRSNSHPPGNISARPGRWCMREDKETLLYPAWRFWPPLIG